MRVRPEPQLVDLVHPLVVDPVIDHVLREDAAFEQVVGIGFECVESFVERPGDERSLGKDLLEYVAGKFPRNKIGKSAKNKLKLLAW